MIKFENYTAMLEEIIEDIMEGLIKSDDKLQITRDEQSCIETWYYSAEDMAEMIKEGEAFGNYLKDVPRLEQIGVAELIDELNNGLRTALDTVITVKEASEKYSKPESSIKYLCTTGKVLSRKARGTWLIDRNSIEKLLGNNGVNIKQ